VNNVEALKAKGIHPLQVGETISSLFSHMIFFHGFVHCDPVSPACIPRPLPQESPLQHHCWTCPAQHPGNILIRKPPLPPPPRTWREKASRVFWGLVRPPPPFEVVVLDHGMYRRMNEKFRRSYCNLWKAFMTR
jgi:aarF domain-containing kinase